MSQNKPDKENHVYWDVYNLYNDEPDVEEMNLNGNENNETSLGNLNKSKNISTSRL